jgi:Flp pilus assembly protein TadG
MLRRSGRGVVHIWFAVGGLMLIGLMGLAIDAGTMVHTGMQLNGASEAAALAGAQALWQGQSAARDAAVAISPNNVAAGVGIALDRNDANSTSGDIVIGRWDPADRSFYAASPRPNAVQVTAKRTSDRNGQLSLYFASIFGAGSMDIQRSATAVTDGIGDGPALAVLDTTAFRYALDLSGGIDLTVAGGPIWVNSSDSQAARLIGGATATYDEMDIKGGYTGAFSPTPRTGRPQKPDPLASLPEPDLAGRTVFHAPLGQPGPNTSQSLTPGYYPDGWDVKGTLTLAPGVYCLGGPGVGTGLKVNSQGSITGSGVMLFIVHPSNVDVTSNGTNLNLTPPDPSVNTFTEAELYQGIAVFQSRNTSAGVKTVSYTLNGSVAFSGTFYYPYANVKVTSGGDNDLARLICWQFNCSGTGSVTIHYLGNQYPVAGPTYLVK